MKRVFVDMSVCILHHGHIRLLEQARALEDAWVVVVLTTDEEVLKYKGYHSELTFEQRKEMLLALKSVDEVIAGPWLITDAFLKEHKADLLVHSGPNFNDVKEIEMINLERTEGVSSEEIRGRSVVSIVERNNSQKCLLTPGPTNIHPSSLLDIRPVFSRGDDDYSEVTGRVLEAVRALAGQDGIAAMQGSATTAIEVATTNFLKGNVVVIVSGYYSERMLAMIKVKQGKLGLASVVGMTYEKFLEQARGLNKIDWIVAAYTETADAFLIDMKKVKKIANGHNARLMIDATGSINLEDHHELADVTMFSSCKGLGGLTGAGFITYDKNLLAELNFTPKEFILDLQTYIDKKTTSPAHTLLSLDSVSANFAENGLRVRQGKAMFVERFSKYLFRPDNQPNLCTKVKNAGLKIPAGMVGYEPRTATANCQVVCHLFEQYPSNRAVGGVYELMKK
jgi:cytidyltransferase-like protein